MVQSLFLARSVTYAQRMQKVLARAGIRSRIFRAPAHLTESGCAYAVRIAAFEASTALYILRREALEPVQMYEFENGNYREVQL